MEEGKFNIHITNKAEETTDYVIYHVLKYEEQIIVFSDNLLQLYNVRMIQFSEGLHQ